MAEGWNGAVAQLGERLVCNQEATGSIPVSSTRNRCRSYVARPAQELMTKGELADDERRTTCDEVMHGAHL